MNEVLKREFAEACYWGTGCTGPINLRCSFCEAIFKREDMKHKMKVKKYVDDSSLTWEERYNRLQAHHLEETKELISVIEELEAELEFFGENYYESYEVIDGDDWF